MHFVSYCDVAVKRILCIWIACQCFDVDRAVRSAVCIGKLIVDRVLRVIV